MREEATDTDPRQVLALVDSQGLIFEGRDQIDEDKRAFAVSRAALSRYGFASTNRHDLEAVVRQVAPTILIGTTGTAGTFTENAIRDMAERVPSPIVLPLSNPTANTEARPVDVYAWSEGRAMVATGSPFEPVLVGGQERLVGQANNVFVFPGVGLGAIVARAREITDRMFLVAATTLADMISTDRIRQGALYPPLADLRRISRAIAIAVAREASQAGVAPTMTDSEIESAVDAAMWTPVYPAVGPW